MYSAESSWCSGSELGDEAAEYERAAWAEFCTARREGLVCVVEGSDPL